MLEIHEITDDTVKSRVEGIKAHFEGVRPENVALNLNMQSPLDDSSIKIVRKNLPDGLRMIGFLSCEESNVRRMLSVLPKTVEEVRFLNTPVPAYFMEALPPSVRRLMLTRASDGARDTCELAGALLQVPEHIEELVIKDWRDTKFNSMLSNNNFPSLISLKLFGVHCIPDDLKEFGGYDNLQGLFGSKNILSVEVGSADYSYQGLYKQSEFMQQDLVRNNETAQRLAKKVQAQGWESLTAEEAERTPAIKYVLKGALSVAPPLQAPQGGTVDLASVTSLESLCDATGGAVPLLYKAVVAGQLTDVLAFALKSPDKFNVDDFLTVHNGMKKNLLAVIEKQGKLGTLLAPENWVANVPVLNALLKAVPEKSLASQVPEAGRLVFKANQLTMMQMRTKAPGMAR